MSVSKIKSKIPIKRPASEDTGARVRVPRIRRPRTSISNQGDVGDATKSASNATSHTKDVDDNGNSAVLEIISIGNDVDTTNENNSKGGVVLPALKIRRHTITVKDKGGNLLKSKKSYKLSYDPNGPPGNEYVIVKELVSDDDANDRALTQLSKKDDRLKVLNTINSRRDVGAALDRLSVHSNQTFVRSRPSSTASSQLFTPSISKTGQSTRTEGVRRKILLSSEQDGPSLNDSQAKSNTAGDVIWNPSPVSVRTPRLLSPRDRSETNILFKYDKNGQTETPNHTKKDDEIDAKRSPSNLPHDQTQSNLSDIRPLTRSFTRSVSKENSNTSLHPLKSKVFNRARKISTPRRTPRFSPVPVIPSFGKTRSSISSAQVTNLCISATPKAIHSDGTFVKDTTLKRFERLNSTESVRSHYDKKLKRKGKTEDAVNTKDDVLTQETEEKRYEHVEKEGRVFILKPKRHRRNAVSKFQKEARNKMEYNGAALKSDETRNTDSNSLVTDPPQGNMHQTQLSFVSRGQLSSGMRSEIEHLIESDETTRLKKAKHISEDLKTMKSKLKDTEFVAKHLDAEARRVFLGKTVLNKLNTLKLKKSNGRPKDKANRPNQPNMRVSPKVRKLHATDVREPMFATKSKLRKGTNSIAKERIKKNKSESISASVLNSKVSDMTWRVQPKIHRFDPNKIKHSTKRYSVNIQELPIEENRTDSVATWLLHSAQGGEIQKRLENASVTTPSTTFTRRRRLHKHVYNKESDAKSASSSSTNLINAGLYMPLRRKRLKRRPMQLKRRLYTQVGKVKGYEVRSVINVIVLQRVNTPYYNTETNMQTL